MKGRSLTFGFNWHDRNKHQLENEIEQFFKLAISRFAESNFEIRTKRLVLPPFAIKDSIDNESINHVISWISNFCNNQDIRWFCVPFTTLDQQMREVNSVAIDIIKRFKNAFINFLVVPQGRISRHAILYAAKFVKTVSLLSNNGYDNFRVGTSFNAKPNGPYFPFTYHSGNNGFSLALELVPSFIDVFKKNKGQKIEVIRNILIEKLTPQLMRINEICLQIEHSIKLEYKGIDISLAPYPDNDENSVAALVELLGIDGFGSYGTVFLTSFLTDILLELIVKSQIRSVGFNGVMYSLLEDTRLGTNSTLREFSIDSLLSYATVCGCGIDMVPVPGNIFDEEIASIMIDIAGISTVLNKPLGVRILPINGKRANELTEFNYDFLYNTRVLEVKNRGCSHDFLNVNDQPFVYLRKGRHEH